MNWLYDGIPMIEIEGRSIMKETGGILYIMKK